MVAWVPPTGATSADEYRHRVRMAFEYPNQRCEKDVMALVTIQSSDNSQSRAPNDARQ